MRSPSHYKQLQFNRSQSVYRLVINMVRTLNELSQLKETNFGQPDPRHGLRLLWWFAHDCVRFDINNCMIALHNPAEDFGGSGFHRFYNRIEDDRLLPNNNFPYYEVGNLRFGKLPHYVTLNYNRNRANSNADRIIVRFRTNLGSFDRIYVTQHSDQVNFNPNSTYRISQGLLRTVSRLSLDEFLRQTRNDDPLRLIFQPQSSYQVRSTHLQSRQPTDDSTCLYIGLVLLCLIIILALFFSFVKIKTFV